MTWKRMRIALGVVTLAVAAPLLVLALLGGPQRAGHAQPPITVAFDMDPTGNVCFGTGNAGGMDCTITQIDSCVQVNDGDSFDFDIVLEGLPHGALFAAPQYWIGWSPPSPAPPAPYLQFAAGTFILNSRTLQTVGINLLVDDPGSGPVFIDASDPPVPHADSPDMTAIADMAAPPGGAETNPPFTQGVLGRYNATVGPGTPPGVYGLIFDTSGTGGPVYMFDVYAMDMCTDPGCTLEDANTGYGLIAVNTPCPPEADLKGVSLSVGDVDTTGDTIPDTPYTPGMEIDVSANVTFDLIEEIHNNGPTAGVVAKVTTECHPPESIITPGTAGGECSLHVTNALPTTVTLDGSPLTCDAADPGSWPAGITACTGVCTAGSCTTSTVVNVVWPHYLDKEVITPALPISDASTIIDEEWDVHCLEPSFHDWHFHSEVHPEDPYILDPEPANDYRDFDLTVGCIGLADLEVMAVSVTDAPPLLGSLAFPAVIIGEDTPLEVTTEVRNDGPHGPLYAHIISNSLVAAYAGTDPGLWPLWGNVGCAVAPLSPVDQLELAVSDPVPLFKDYEIICDMGGIGYDDDADGVVDEDPVGGAGIDHDHDGFIDEDACDGVDNDADTLIDEDDPNGDEDCDWNIATDDVGCDGVAGTFDFGEADGAPTSFLTCVATFFGPGEPHIDEDSPFYLAIVYFQSDILPKDPHIEDPDPADNYNGAGLVLTVVRPFTPSFSFTIDETAPADEYINPVDDNCVAGQPCKSLSEISVPVDPPPGGPPAGQPTPLFVDQIGTQPGEWSLASGLDIPNGEKVGKAQLGFNVSLLPDQACNTPVAGIWELYDACLPPPGHPYIPGPSYLEEPGCQVDMPDQEAALASPLADTSWSHSLDHMVRAIYAGQPDAYLWARYASSINPALNVMINLLVFDLSGGSGVGPWLRVLVFGDPAAPLGSYPYICPPLTGEILVLGETPGSADPILSCNQASPVPGTATAGPWRDDIDLSVTLYDDVNCVVQADLKVNDLSVTDAPPVVDPLGLPTVIIGEEGSLEVTTVVHNNGPYGPVQADIMSSYNTVYTGGDPALWPTWGNQGCTVTPLAPPVDQIELPVAAPIDPLIDTYSITCDMGGIGWDDDGDALIDEDPLGGPGVDNDADGLVDEDPCNVVDDDADTLIDEDDPAGDQDCDGLFDEDSPFYLVGVNFEKEIQPQEPHIVDFSPANNHMQNLFTLVVIQPFTPSFSATIDELEAGQQTDPVDDECIVGQPCKVLKDFVIPAGQPLPGFVSIEPGTFTVAHGTEIPNGAKVGKLDYTICVSPVAGMVPCETPLVASVPLWDACLPESIEPGCLDDYPDSQAALYPNNFELWPGQYGSAFDSYSTSLDGDWLLRWIAADPSNTLWARYVGAEPAISMPLNLLVFRHEEPGPIVQWIIVLVTGNPLEPSVPGGLYFCSPLEAHALLLGSTEDNPDVPGDEGGYIRMTCDVPGTNTHLAQLYRTDLGKMTELADGSSCLIAETDISVGLYKDETVGNAAPMSEDGACDDGLDNDADTYTDLADADCDLLGSTVPKDYPVTIEIMNGDGPDEVDVDLTIVSHDPCQADWIPAPGDTPSSSRDGSTYTSTLQWRESILAPLELRQALRYYTLDCSEAGTFIGPQAIQVTAAVSTVSLPDPNLVNNEATNQIASIEAISDIDGDFVLNADDLCPLEPEDYDGIEDEDGCPETDADSDGILDEEDACPEDPEDYDGIQDEDGCPETDADSDGFPDDQETALGSDPLNEDSTPEHISLVWTCTDEMDNDLDALVDGYDLGCDVDADGIPNVFDACPALAEDMDGYEDADGCPEADNDMDGVCDPGQSIPGYCTGSDSCPNVAEDIDDFHDEDGCPDPDNDGDGFPDWTDDCPATDWTAGPDGDPATLDDNPLDELGVPIDTREDYDGIIDWDGCHDSPGDDWDGDGMSDENEVLVAGTNPTNMDTDNDGLCDGYRPPICASEDANNNGIVDPGETDPNNPDTDGDGLSDGLEKGLTVPESPDTDTSSPNWQPDADPSTTTDPLDADSDDDGVVDGAEDTNHNGSVGEGESDVNDGDTDDDGHGDGDDNCPTVDNPGQGDFEADGIGDVCDPDDDNDSFTDELEIYLGTDPRCTCPNPLDIDMDGAISVTGDVANYVGRIGATPSDDNWWRRLDLNMSGDISVTEDIFNYMGRIGETCR